MSEKISLDSSAYAYLFVLDFNKGTFGFSSSR